jgi:hypothetical protein
MSGVDPFKIPVLYEHSTAAKWLPFGRPPTELMFDRVTIKYAAIVCSGYGLTLSDIGFASSTSGGDTLAGSIRQERKSKRQGYAKAKHRTAAWFNRLIDPTQKQIKFEWIDLDDELAIAQGRSRLANATAFTALSDAGYISVQEGRLQMIADGMFTIAMPEKLPPEAKPKIETMFKDAPERPGMLGKPVSPSQGGHGEVLPRSQFEEQLLQIVNVPDIKLKRLSNAVLFPLKTLTNKALDELEPKDLGLWAEWQRDILWGNITEEIPELITTLLQTSKDNLNKVMDGDTWWEVLSNADDIAGDMARTIWEVRAEQAYINGECNSIETYQIIKSQDTKLKKTLKVSLLNINKQLKSLIQQAIIVGTTNYLAKRGEKLDENLKIDDNLINEIRSQLIFLYEMILTDFGKNLQKLMESK